MISHTDCEHESTPRARAKCRRAQGASVKTIDFEPSGRREPKEAEPYGYYNSRTPNDKSKECHICHIYRITGKGTYEGRTLLCCDSCSWRIRGADDYEEID